MNALRIYDPMEFYIGKGEIPEAVRERVALKLIAAKCCSWFEGTRVAFAGEYVAIAWCDRLNGEEPGLVVDNIDQLIDAYTDELRHELGRDELVDLLRGI
jgi:hypothetical protein